ncbi:hypothetical protein D8S85_01575 [Butyricimonas faecalis]|uniref:Uncharacterized protein n=1 Tax=Butyricimonas faecalis TaxID=2093856 RepID=A0A3S9VP86_9BACT|nr:hypothetical protein D8S85_01575 [Butyricimonas faecalis]
MPTSKQRENGENRSLSPRNLRFTKIRHIGDNFADWGCKIRDGFTDSSTDFGVAFCGLARDESCCTFGLWCRII